jgi:hypothetical protein
MNYLIWLICVVGSALLLATGFRWFEQTAVSVDRGQWRRLAILIVFPPAVWIYRRRDDGSE